MSQAHSVLPSDEITFAPEHSGSTKKIWKTFWILTIVTLIELACGYWIYTIHVPGTPSTGMVFFLKGIITILTVVKAWYIVSVFMHLGDEIRNFVMTIVLPLSLFIWFIIAFLWDGSAWRNFKNTNYFTRPYVEKVVTPAPKPSEKP